jgi:hypothetical protein
MGKFITIKSEGQKTIFIDADKVNSVEIHRTGKNSEKKLLLLTADRHEDRVYIKLEDYDVDIPELVEQIRAAGNDLIEITSVRGVDETREMYKEYISPNAIAYIQAEEDKFKYRGLNIYLGIKGDGRKGYNEQTEETFTKLLNAFVNKARKNVKAIPATKAIIGFNEGTDLYIDAREITRINVDSYVTGRIDMKNVGHLTFKTKTSKIAYDFENAAKSYKWNPDNSIPQDNSDALYQEMCRASSDAARSLITVARALANEVDGMVEIPSYEPDLNSPNPHFFYARANFVKPTDVVGIDTEDSPDNERGIFNYYSIYFELSKETREMMDHIRMDYPTAEERDHALEVYMQRCEALTAQENKPKPNRPPGSNGFKF